MLHESQCLHLIVCCFSFSITARANHNVICSYLYICAFTFIIMTVTEKWSLKGNEILKGNNLNPLRVETTNIIYVQTTWKKWFRLISGDKIGFMFSRLSGTFEKCEDVLICRKQRGAEHQTRSLSHQFLIRASERKTGNRWKSSVCVCLCVCVFVPLWWSACRSCCRSLISARIWGRGVSHSAPSPGFYLPPSGSDLELWTTAERRGSATQVLRLFYILKCTDKISHVSLLRVVQSNYVTECDEPTIQQKNQYHSHFISITNVWKRPKSIIFIDCLTKYSKAQLTFFRQMQIIEF